MNSSSQPVNPTATKHSNHIGMNRDTSPKQMVAFQRVAELLGFGLITERKANHIRKRPKTTQQIENCRGDIQGRNFVKTLSRRWNANVQ